MEAFLASLLGGVAGKLSAAGVVAQVAPTAIEGTIKNISEIPKAITAFETLAKDVASGQWSKVGGDISGALAEGEKLASNYGLDLPKLNALPKKLAKPATTAGATIQNS